MTYSLVHGISLVTIALICQELEITNKVEVSKLSGMHAGTSKAQVLKVWTHSEETSGSVKGSGDITITPGVGASGVTGITVIETLKYKQSLTNPSDWEYNWMQFPYAS